MDPIDRQAEIIDAIKNADVCIAWNGEISAEDAADIAVRATKNSVVASIEDLLSAQPEITLESAIDYLHSIGWMQEHDRALSSVQPEPKKGHKINQHSYPSKWLCSECGAKHFDFSDKFCSKCGAKLEEGDYG